MINVKQMEAHWDDLLRVTSSLRKGTVTASLIVGKLASYPRQNGLAWTLREVGRVEKSPFALEWLQSPLPKRPSGRPKLMENIAGLDKEA